MFWDTEKHVCGAFALTVYTQIQYFPIRYFFPLLSKIYIYIFICICIRINRYFFHEYLPFLRICFLTFQRWNLDNFFGQISSTSSGSRNSAQFFVAFSQYDRILQLDITIGRFKDDIGNVMLEYMPYNQRRRPKNALNWCESANVRPQIGSNQGTYLFPDKRFARKLRPSTGWLLASHNIRSIYERTNWHTLNFIRSCQSNVNDLCAYELFIGLYIDQSHTEMNHKNIACTPENWISLRHIGCNKSNDSNREHGEMEMFDHLDLYRLDLV